ncbi:sugar phosphate isomerase/epimerase [Gemmata sp. JC673]|uniref:Sugar phosphate isomerase/epimerase n=1 Tax=Gemmata algarum TaxID=2975278 RepID=A0ABU5F7L2_9BACT|nr:sugar phosphate isomerase/epimerase [Gemmata algarum]MDY3563108.1 sugar phosphate isomerase/epimerase [Gemmata algarum]
MSTDLSRRAVLAGGAAALVARPAEARADAPKSSFGFCLNTSTVRDKDGKSRPITELIDIAAKAGYDAFEPWVSEVDAYLKGGGTLKELRTRVADAGLKIADLIGFAEWIVEDTDRRKRGLEQAKRDMDWAAELGCPRVAAPPVGATGGASKRDDPKFTQPIIDLVAAADRYRALLDLGAKMGVIPVAEVWGFSKTMRRLGEALLVAVECGDARGCVLPDVYHLYKGGSDFAGLPLLSASAIGIFHVNDYPKIGRDQINDADRVYPGDGIAPLKDVFAALRKMNYTGFVSLELFNRNYWKQDPHVVAKTGLAKMRAVAG